jgi:hypothetical protein
MKLQINKIYDVFSNRKGEFRIKLTSQCETWATGIIIKGKAKAICEYNEREKGEKITVRKEFSSFTEVF